MRLILGASLVLLLGVSCAGVSAAPPAVPGGTDQDEVLRFVERLLGGHPAGNAELLFGDLPADFELRLPAEAVVVGSVAYPNGQVQVVLDMPMAPNEALRALEDELEGQGWRPRDLGNVATYSTGGFISSPGGHAIFCNEAGAYFSVMAQTLENGQGSDVRIHKGASGSGSPCTISERPSSPPYAEIFPPLHAPPGTVQRGGGGGGSSDRVDTHTRLQGDISAVALEEHYRRQLEAADWTLIGQGAADASAWSHWRFSDNRGGQWAASLFTVAVQREGQDLAASLQAVLVSSN